MQRWYPQQPLKMLCSCLFIQHTCFTMFIHVLSETLVEIISTTLYVDENCNSVKIRHCRFCIAHQQTGIIGYRIRAENSLGVFEIKLRRLALGRYLLFFFLRAPEPDWFSPFMWMRWKTRVLDWRRILLPVTSSTILAPAHEACGATALKIGKIFRAIPPTRVPNPWPLWFDLPMCTGKFP